MCNNLTANVPFLLKWHLNKVFSPRIICFHQDNQPSNETYEAIFIIGNATETEVIMRVTKPHFSACNIYLFIMSLACRCSGSPFFGLKSCCWSCVKKIIPFFSILPDTLVVWFYYLTGFMSLHQCLTFILSKKVPPVTHLMCLGCELG